jgi:hypothetical protein
MIALAIKEAISNPQASPSKRESNRLSPFLVSNNADFHEWLPGVS